jgi:hypothetical protein
MIAFVLGLDAFKHKKEKRTERKQRAKARKKAASAAAHSSTVLTAATKANASGGAPLPSAQVVEYKDPRKRRQQRLAEEAAVAAGKKEGLKRVPDPLASSEEVSMKQARFDVFKFGVRGLKGDEKQDAELAQLVRLGAKPPKNKCLPYAELKEKRKKDREEERARKETERISGVVARAGVARGKGSKTVKSKAGSAETKKTKAKGGRMSIGSKVGQFDGGMLRLSAKDLQKLKGRVS